MSDPSSFRPEARSPRGLQDRRARDIALERRILANVSAAYERFGFEAFDTPAFEYADALGKFLPDSDRPNAGVFALKDDDDQWLALRYDLTAPLARFVAQTREGLPRPFRRYSYGPVWRNEKPGPGRFREFIQCDADTVGSDRPEADAEIIALAVQGLTAAGVPPRGAVVKINNRKLINGVLASAGVADAGQRLVALRAVDKLDRLGPEGVRALLGEGRLDESGDFTRGAGLASHQADRVLAYLAAGGGTRSEVVHALAPLVQGAAEGEEGLRELDRIAAALAGFGVGEAEAPFDPAVVRGLEYYTGAVFEAEIVARDAAGAALRVGSVGGGGRYDDLVARFTGETTPATGFSFGVSRLAVALGALNAAGAQETRGPVVVMVLDDDGMADYVAAATELRRAGIAAEVYLGRAGLKAQMKYADRRRSPAVVILGGDERAAGRVTIKDLDQGRALSQGLGDNEAWRAQRPGQMTVDRSRLTETIHDILTGRPAAG